MKQEFINLADHPDFVITPGVRGKFVWHGQTYDAGKIPMEVAERMAREDATRYINFSDARIAREAEAKAATLLPPVPPAAPVAQPPAKQEPSTATQKTTAKAAETSEATGNGKSAATKDAQGNK